MKALDAYLFFWRISLPERLCVVRNNYWCRQFNKRLEISSHSFHSSRTYLILILVPSLRLSIAEIKRDRTNSVMKTVLNDQPVVSLGLETCPPDPYVNKRRWLFPKSLNSIAATKILAVHHFIFENVGKIAGSQRYCAVLIITVRLLWCFFFKWEAFKRRKWGWH